MTSYNSTLDAQIVGIQSPLAYNPAFGNQGMIQQLIDLISMEEASPDKANRLFLDEMSPACRNVLYKTLKDLQGDVDQTSFITGGGNPFTETTGWTDGGAEQANHAFSEDDNNLIGTITAGGSGELNVFNPLTTVIGVEYLVTFLDLTVEDACALNASNASALTSPLDTEALTEVGGPEADGNYPSISLQFVATATTTYIGLKFTTTPADGIIFTLGGVTVAPVIPR